MSKLKEESSMKCKECSRIVTSTLVNVNQVCFFCVLDTKKGMKKFTEQIGLEKLEQILP